MSSWANEPLQFVVKWHCPHCYTTETPIYFRSPRNGDGSRSQRCICKRCSKRWVRVVELPTEFDDYSLPNFGNEDIDHE